MPDGCGSDGWQPYLMFYLANKFIFKGAPKSTYQLGFVASDYRKFQNASSLSNCRLQKVGGIGTLCLIM